MIHIKWDIKRGADIYRQVFVGRLKSWISTGKIKRGETVVLRSGFSGWRKPEELKELIPYFQRHERAEARKLKTRKQRKEVLVEKNPINPVRNTESSRKENKISNGVKSILIIDDEKDLCLLLGDALRIHGYNVKSVNTKRDAMDSLRMQAPDMVFCDLKLPDGDGMAILTKIRAISPRTIVSMITAYGSKETRDEAKRLGAYGFIDKPFSEEDILENIRDLSKPKRPKTGII